MSVSFESKNFYEAHQNDEDDIVLQQVRNNQLFMEQCERLPGIKRAFAQLDQIARGLKEGEEEQRKFYEAWRGFKDYVAQAMPTAKEAAAISKVLDICDERIRYNQFLLDNVVNDEFDNHRQFGKLNKGTLLPTNNKSLASHRLNSVMMKEALLRGAAADLKCYEDIR